MDIVDGDNAAEIAGGQRGLMMMLLASERANERIERVARGQEHHCILRFHPLPPIPDPAHHRRRFFATSRFLSTRRGPAHYPSFSNSDIPISRAVALLPPFVASSTANYSPSSISALNGNISRPRSARALAGSFFQHFRLKRDRDGRCVFF